ncbi:conserved hypothetical protein [Candidatus Sulfopaludibacter sp. SbA3]|nr:conserved hypothetical protein [Candidatus Sulfopaludibacter sp. SbA3]
MRWLLFIALVYQAHSADVCEPRKFQGAYGVQLSGTTTISGERKPVALVGRLVFDGTGTVSGYVSVNYTGLLLGNPVNGTYEAHEDCSLTWSLQDDSGAFQHFAGTMASDLVHIQFHQTDDGGARQGVMVRTPKVCSAATFLKRYTYTISGSTTPMLPGETAHAVSSNGVMEVSEGGNFTITADGPHAPSKGTLNVDSDCITNIALALSVGDAGATVAMKLRGVLLDEGKEILAIQTDPGTTVTAKFNAQ